MSDGERERTTHQEMGCIATCGVDSRSCQLHAYGLPSASLQLHLPVMWVLFTLALFSSLLFSVVVPV